MTEKFFRAVNQSKIKINESPDKNPESVNCPIRYITMLKSIKVTDETFSKGGMLFFQF